MGPRKGRFPLDSTRETAPEKSQMVRKRCRRTTRALLLLPLVLLGSVLLFAASGAVLAADYDHEIADVMGGKVSGVSATVNGSGGLWYGQSLRVSFVNN